MSDRAPYSRVYWGIVDDDKFQTVYDDDRHLATWLRLLLVADQSWPASAHLPAGCRRSSVAELERVQLIDLAGNRYRVRGLDAERGRRAEAGRIGGLASGRSRAVEQTLNDRSPTPGTKTNLDETRRDEDETSRAETSRDAADVYWQLTGRYPAGKALTWIDNLAGTYGHDAVARALVKAQTVDRNVSDLLSRSQDILRADARKLDLQEREAEAARLREKRAIPRVEEPWRAELREAIRKQYEDVA
jgi:hypothetical protein